MTASRRFGVFAIVFAIAYPIIYIIATELNWAAFTYHSALGEFGLGPNRPREGTPAMYWYGWITTSAVSAGIVATIAAYLPDNLTQKLPAASSWVVPLAAMVTAAGLMVKMYFTR
jgi:hypothetical protein